ncbi:MAG: protein jag, partial [Spirochaetaceae bacterium]|nr:protein jag [Spirochaetaceae bacterium]
DAIDKAVKELGLEQDSFDVEILESQKGGFFKKGYVKLRIHTGAVFSEEKDGNAPEYVRGGGRRGGNRQQRQTERSNASPQPPENEFEEALLSFGKTILKYMGHDNSDVVILFRESRKICLGLVSEDSSVLIGRKGRTLDALQLLFNNYAAKLGHGNLRIILDCEDYRLRREDSLVRLAYSAADKVRRSRSSILLEPMNPFDRRLIHTTLSDMHDVSTESEGQGNFKQVRIFYKSARR